MIGTRGGQLAVNFVAALADFRAMFDARGFPAARRTCARAQASGVAEIKRCAQRAALMLDYDFL